MNTPLCMRRQPMPTSRRNFLAQCGGGFGLLGLAHLLGGDPLMANDTGALNPHALPHPRRAKSVIQLFMVGGASQCDTFDYKPELIRRHGEKVSFAVTGGTIASPGPVLKSPWDWKQHGQSGRWVTSALPNLARHVDDMAFLMAMHAPTSEHSAGQTMQTSGFVMQGFPTVGSWVSYALGSLNENLPRYVALPDPVGLPWTGKVAWTNGFLPALHQGTMLNPSAANPVPDLFPPKGSAFGDPQAQRDGLDLINTLNRRQLAAASYDSRLEARIASYELAARLQTAVPDLLDLTGESAAVQNMYGIGDPVTEPIGRNCLIARRLVERGVRFVQLWVGSGVAGNVGNWDNHTDIRPGSDFEKMCRRSDKPIAGLLEDLKQRGLLDETLVYWTTEFGRTPYSQGGNGRDHNGNTFVSWLAGGGIKGGVSYGQSDEFSYAAAENPTMCYEQHATILHLLGLDHKTLSFRHSGIDRRLTDVHGQVIPEIIA